MAEPNPLAILRIIANRFSPHNAQVRSLMRALFFFLFTLPSITLACSVPKHGYGFALEALIDEAKTIVIVELQETTESVLGYEHTLIPVDTIKGEAQDKYFFLSHSNEHESSTFSDHNDIRFWATDREIGRSSWPCCICGPDHTFKKGFKYLFFPRSTRCS